MLWKIQEICSKMGTKFFEIDEKMFEIIDAKVGKPQIQQAKMRQFEPSLKSSMIPKNVSQKDLQTKFNRRFATPCITLCTECY